MMRVGPEVPEVDEVDRVLDRSRNDRIISERSWKRWIRIEHSRRCSRSRIARSRSVSKLAKSQCRLVAGFAFAIGDFAFAVLESRNSSVLSQSQCSESQ